MYNLHPRVTDDISDIDKFNTVYYLLLQMFPPKWTVNKKKKFSVGSIAKYLKQIQTKQVQHNT